MEDLQKYKNQVETFRQLEQMSDALVQELQSIRYKLQKELDQLNNKYSWKTPLIGSKHSAWDQFMMTMVKYWKRFTVTQEEWDLVVASIREVKDTLSYLRHRPNKAASVIDILNSRIGLELETL